MALLYCLSCCLEWIIQALIFKPQNNSTELSSRRQPLVLKIKSPTPGSYSFKTQQPKCLPTTVALFILASLGHIT